MRMACISTKLRETDRFYSRRPQQPALGKKHLSKTRFIHFAICFNTFQSLRCVFNVTTDCGSCPPAGRREASGAGKLQWLAGCGVRQGHSTRLSRCVQVFVVASMTDALADVKFLTSRLLT